MTHVYAQHIEKKNLNGYVVSGSVPFLKLWDAECYCMEQNIKPDAENLVYDPKNARLLAFIIAPEVRRMRDKLESKLQECHAKRDVLVKKHDLLKAKNDTMADVEATLVKRDLERLLGQSTALSEQLCDIMTRCGELFRLSTLTVKNDERKGE